MNKSDQGKGVTIDAASRFVATREERLIQHRAMLPTEKAEAKHGNGGFREPAKRSVRLCA
jgi:hypothetical protein